MVNLLALMEATQGHPELAIGLIDGPVATTHPGFGGTRFTSVPQAGGGSCADPSSAACLHGTFVAGIMVARRGSGAPAICPCCPLLMRPIFPENSSPRSEGLSANPEELAVAILDCVQAGVRILNLSVALTRGDGGGGESRLEQALNLAARRGVLVVAAAGNYGALGSTTITRHPWVISVIACDRRGMPVPESNLGNSIGRRGLGAPGEDVSSLRATGGMMSASGTSVSAPFVTGAVALAWSQHRQATAGQVRSALLQAHLGHRRGVVPSMLDAGGLCRALQEPGTAPHRKQV